MNRRAFIDDRNCFVCGEDNPDGLQVEPEVQPGECHISWTPRPCYQGYADVLHGGIAALLLDEAMAYAARSLVGNCATAEMSTRFMRPISTHVPLRVDGRVVDRRRRLLTTEAELTQDGNVCARATARFVLVRQPVPGE